MGRLPQIKYYIEYTPSKKGIESRIIEIDPKRIHNTLIPEDMGNTAIVYCVIEQDARFQGREEVLRSDKYVLARLDLSLTGMNVKNLDAVLQSISYFVSIEKGKVQAKTYVDYNKYHLESDGESHERSISTDNLVDIRVPKGCKQFMTYGRLESTFMVNGSPLRLRSGRLNVQKYYVGDVVRTEPASMDGYEFVYFEDGGMVPVHERDSIISPSQINDNGELTL